MGVLESKTGSQTTCQKIIHPPAGAQPCGAIFKIGSTGPMGDRFDSFPSALIVRITVS
jgi:hypothetical protein